MKTRRNTKHTHAGLLRSGTILSIIALLVGGVTFAAIRSQNNVITGSRMTSSSANLQISKQINGLYNTTMAGYDFLDISPGGTPMPQTGNDLFLRNFGTTNLDLSISMNSSRLTNVNAVDLRHAYLLVMDSDGITQFGKYSLADLSTAYTTGKPLPLNIVIGKDTTVNFKLRMQLDESATDPVSQVELTNLDYVFSGIAV